MVHSLVHNLPLACSCRSENHKSELWIDRLSPSQLVQKVLHHPYSGLSVPSSSGSLHVYTYFLTLLSVYHSVPSVLIKRYSDKTSYTAVKL